MNQPTYTDPGLPFRTPLLYKKTEYVHAFGRERDKYGLILYYWVVDKAGKRFKANKTDLES